MKEQYFYEVFEGIPRQGPGLNKSTKKAYNIVKGYLPEYPEILDIGCGKGAQTVKLAKLTRGHITAIDNHKPFIDELNKNLEEELLTDNVQAQQEDMFKLPFRKGQFDVIWSEGAIYIMGFKKGLKDWSNYLKTGGHMVISEAVYLNKDIPDELRAFWNQEYPEIDTIEKKSGIIVEAGYKNVMHFTLPQEGWKEEYYGPLQKQISELRDKNKGIKEAEEIYDELQHEINMYEKYHEYYGYEFFIIRKK